MIGFLAFPVPKLRLKKQFFGFSIKSNKSYAWPICRNLPADGVKELFEPTKNLESLPVRLKNGMFWI